MITHVDLRLLFCMMSVWPNYIDIVHVAHELVQTGSQLSHLHLECT